MSESITPEEIKAMRQAAGLTQEQFAHEVGVTTSVVCRWEKGKFKPGNLSVQAIRAWQERQKS